METVVIVEQVVHTVQIPSAAAVVLQESVQTVQVPDTAAVAVVLQESVQVVQVPGATAVAVVVQESVQVTTVGMQGSAGPTGLAGNLAAPPIAFAFGDASPRNVLTLTGAIRVLSVRVNVSLAFNGLAASFKLGTAAQPELLVASAQVDLGTATEFEVNPKAALAAGEPIVLTLAPGVGGNQGVGWIVIEQTGIN